MLRLGLLLALLLLLLTLLGQEGTRAGPWQWHGVLPVAPSRAGQGWCSQEVWLSG